MTWKDVIKLVIAFMASIGGAGAIIVGIVKYASQRIAESLSAKYQLELDKRLEEYKNKLDKRNYVSKARFDTEFTVAKELMIACKTMINSVYFLFPNEKLEQVYERNDGWGEKNQKCLLTAIDSSRKFEELLEGNSPFITKEIYDEFSALDMLCRKNILSYSCRNENDSLYATIPVAHRKKIMEEAYKRTWEIQQRFETISDMLRKHFQDMDIQ